MLREQLKAIEQAESADLATEEGRASFEAAHAQLAELDSAKPSNADELEG